MDYWSLLVVRIVALTAASGAVGWFFGHPLEISIVALLIILWYWSRELRYLAEWINKGQGKPPLLSGCGDIAEAVYTQRKESQHIEDRLENRVGHMLAALDSMTDGIVIIDSMRRFYWCNSSAGNMLALRYPEDTAKPIVDLVSRQEFSQYLTAGDYEAPLQFQFSRNLELQVVITRFARDDLLLYLRDVTRRVRQEQVRKDFVGNVSHELRTPLTVISGYLETFLSTPDTLPPQLVKPVKQMSQQANRMENLLEDLLWLSRIESDEREEKRESVDVVAMLEELRDQLSVAYPNRKLILRLSSQDRVVGDYRELYSAASNLVQNAIKYSSEDTPVTVSWRVGIGGLHLSVSDLGRGIDKKHIPRLTQRFYRVDDSRSSATGGTGLGLAIVKHVAVSHGAQLKIESEVGKGSVFTLVFPIHAAWPIGEGADGY